MDPVFWTLVAILLAVGGTGVVWETANRKVPGWQGRLALKVGRASKRRVGRVARGVKSRAAPHTSKVWSWVKAHAGRAGSGGARVVATAIKRAGSRATTVASEFRRGTTTRRMSDDKTKSAAARGGDSSTKPPPEPKAPPRSTPRASAPQRGTITMSEITKPIEAAFAKLADFDPDNLAEVDDLLPELSVMWAAVGQHYEQFIANLEAVGIAPRPLQPLWNGLDDVAALATGARDSRAMLRKHYESFFDQIEGGERPTKVGLLDPAKAA